MSTFSIIIPTNNSGLTIKRCVDSVREQSYADWELLVMDGESKDSTIDIVRSYQDNRICVFSEPDEGIYDAMNKGIDKSSGEWLLFLGSDDYLFNKDVLADMVKYLTDEYDVVYGEVESNLPERNRGDWSMELLGANRCHQAIFYKRSFFGKSLRYNLKYPVLADFDMNLRWFLNKRYEHRYVPIVISHYSDGGYSSYTEDEAFYKDFELNKLKYNFRVLTSRDKKTAARKYINANPSNIFVKVVFTFYAYYMGVIQRVGGLLHSTRCKGICIGGFC